PQTHLFNIKLQVPDWKKDILKIQFPVWTPGSYLVREYSGHIQQVRAYDSESKSNLWLEKVSKNCWQINTESTETVI
ncbi:hypothetical protein R0K19_28650, partial [Bacillus sp. SIMBA_161]